MVKKKTKKKTSKVKKKTVKKKNVSRETKPRKLTGKQDRFCREYIIDHNGTQAVIRAGYSPKAAKETAHKLVTKGHIKKRIAELEKPVLDELGITKKQVIKGFADIAFCEKPIYKGAIVKTSDRLKGLKHLGDTKELNIFGDDGDRDKDQTPINEETLLKANEKLAKDIAVELKKIRK